MDGSDSEWRREVREQAPLLGLILLILAVFGLQSVVGAQVFPRFAMVPAEIAASWENLLRGTADASDIGDFSTLLASAFLHADPAHLLYNLLFLWIFAGLTAKLLGPSWMFIIFLVTALGGAIGHTLFNAGDSTPMLGASGAVMGFEGAYLGMAARARLPDPRIWPIARPVPPGNLVILALMGIAMDVMGLMDHGRMDVAYGAHVGGFVSGVFLTSFLLPAPKGGG